MRLPVFDPDGPIGSVRVQQYQVLRFLMPRKVFPFLVLFACLGGFVRAADTDPKPNPRVACTYECAGLYWRTSEAGVCRIRYTEEGRHPGGMAWTWYMTPAMASIGEALSG